MLFILPCFCEDASAAYFTGDIAIEGGTVIFSVSMEVEPVAYYPGEEVTLEKALKYISRRRLGEELKGIFQYINQSFASILTQKYETVSREQDLGKKGLRQAKGSSNPVDFVEKNKVRSQ